MSNTTTVTKHCPFCHKMNTLIVSTEGLRKWQAGTTIQSAFPKMSVNDRELMISGICPSCWSNVFPDC